LKIFFILLLTLQVWAAEKAYSVRAVYGTPTGYDLGQVVSGQFGANYNDFHVYSIDGGYRLVKSAFSLPLDFYAKSGLSYYDEGSYKSSYGADIYIKALWNFDFLKNRVRLGFGEGISYTSRVLMAEYIDATEQNDNTSKFLNYLDISVDFDFGKLIAYKPLYETYIGFVIKHRSGIFGLINNVKHGGSNYNSFYIQKNF
jgi:outer membrane protein